MIASRPLPRTVVVTLAVAVALTPGLGGMGGQAAADDTSTVELVLQDLDFIVEDALRLEFVVVGDAPYAEDYIAGLKASAPDGVLFPGYVFGDGYAELVRNCGVMCAPTEVGGTHPVIIEAMSAGAAMVVSDHAPNLEVVDHAAATFSLAAAPASLAGVLSRLIADPERRRQLGESASARAATRFGWSTCADRYLMLAGEISARGA